MEMHTASHSTAVIARMQSKAMTKQLQSQRHYGASPEPARLLRQHLGRCLAMTAI